MEVYYTESFKNESGQTNGSNNDSSTKQVYNKGNLSTMGSDDELHHRNKRHEPEWIRQSIEENDELYNLRRVRRTSSLNVLQEDPSERTHYPESIDENILQGNRYEEGTMAHVNDVIEEDDYDDYDDYDDEDHYYQQEETNHQSRKGMDLQEMYAKQRRERERVSSEGRYSRDGTVRSSNNSDGENNSDIRSVDDVRLGDAIDSGDEEDGSGSGLDKIPIDDSESSQFLKKNIEEDILRTLPSLCVFQVIILFLVQSEIDVNLTILFYL